MDRESARGQSKVGTWEKGERGRSKCPQNVWASFMDIPKSGNVTAGS